MGIAAPTSADPQELCQEHQGIPEPCALRVLPARLRVPRGCGEWEIQKPCPYAEGPRTSRARGAEPSPAAAGSYQPLRLRVFTARSRLCFF